jgi:hypothetical protein
MAVWVYWLVALLMLEFDLAREAVARSGSVPAPRRSDWSCWVHSTSMQMPVGQIAALSSAEAGELGLKRKLGLALEEREPPELVAESSPPRLEEQRRG